MSPHASRVLVVGAGVVGLSVAVRLLEAGHRVDVVARDLPAETTSAVAAAFWYPYLASPRDRVLGWAACSYEVLAGLAATEPDAGVAMVPGTELLDAPTPDPWWVSAVPTFARATPPASYAGGGSDAWGDAWTFTAPVLDMSRYLPWLTGRVEALGGTVTRLNLSALPAGGDIVVDCAGLGARLLAADHTVTPVAGQVVVLEQVGLDRWWLAEGDAAGPGPTYVIPRSREIVVGGTEDHGEWSRTPSPRTAAAILERATAIVPELAGARTLRHKVGLRPARPEVRLERDPHQQRVVHCYGHGGAGVTLSWGCAAEVAALVEEVVA